MAEQTDLGKGVLVSGIVAGVIAIAAGIFFVPSAPDEKKAYAISNATPDYLKKNANEGKKLVTELDAAKHTVKDSLPPASKQNRVSPLFLAPSLWQVAIEKNGGKELVVMDILDPKAEQVHSGIDNAWFLQYGLTDALCVSNGPALDPDGDGFSNAEEHKLGTDPSKKESAPALHGTDYIKLSTVGKRTTKTTIYLQDMNADYNYITQTGNLDSVTLKVLDSSGKEIKELTKATLKPGDTFGITTKEPNRFRLEKITSGDKDGHIIVVDTIAPQDGEQDGFEIKPGKNNLKEIVDTWVTLRPTAGAKMPASNDADALKAAEIKVLVGASFALPGEESTKCVLKAYNSKGTDKFEEGSSQILIEGSKFEVTAPKAK
ncbi:MAG: hypothetical protein E7031_07750 [Akkermansiaceae bacterium]|nr:hypothetical protein [Akkermansiaceae bacterium]